MYLHNCQANSTSKPINFPEASFEFQGGYAPSVPILILSALAELIKNKDKRKVKNIDYGYVGDIKSIDSEFITKLIKSKTYPVFCPITYDNKGYLLNTNADTIATKISIEMTKYFDVYLYYCFDKKGVIIENKVCNRLNENDYIKYLKTNQIKDGMIPKLENSFHSIRNGVKKVFIGDIDIFEKSNNNTEICLI